MEVRLKTIEKCMLQEPLNNSCTRRMEQFHWENELNICGNPHNVMMRMVL